MERIQLRRDTSTRWREVNPILMEGEVGFETDTRLRKIGDGVNRWNDLEYLKAEGIVQEIGNSEDVSISQTTLSNATFLNRVNLKSSNDLDLCTQIGIYTWINDEVPINSPVQGLGLMNVFPYLLDKDVLKHRIVQQVFDYYGRMYVRYKGSGEWGDWNRPAEKSILDNTVDNTFTYRRSLNSDNNLDEISHIGIYSWISSSVPQNAPVSYGGVLLLFPYFRTEYTELSRTVQIVIASSGKMFSRYRTTSGWGSWVSGGSGGSGGSGETYEDRLMRAFLDKTFTTWQPEGNIPRNSQELSYYSGAISGLPYSSVFNFGNDIYYNRGLSSFFSAVKNKGSVLYSKGYGQDTRRGSYYGTVCSTFGSYISGQKIYYTTTEIPEVAEEITYVDIEQINIGDILWTSGHCKVVSSVNVDEDGIYNIVVTEQGGYNMMETVYDKDGFEKILKGIDPHDKRVFKLYRFQNQRIPVLPKIEYSENVISEYGDRTYFEQGQDVFIAVKDGDHINISDGSNTNRYLLSGMSSKIVNGIELYNVRPYLSEAGEYDLYTDNDDRHAKLSVIDMGDVILDDITVRLTGYSYNVKPSWYNVIYLIEAEEGEYPYFPAPEGYMGHGAVMCKDLIKDNTFNVIMRDVKDYASGYYVRCYYDTKFGLAYKDSNIIMIK